MAAMEDKVAPAMPYSIQLFSAQRFPPVLDHLPRLAALGYGNVETTEDLCDDAPALRRALDDSGLSALSGHFSLERLDSDLDGVCRTADTLDMRLIVCPFLTEDQRPASTDDWRRFGSRLATIARQLKSRGFRFAWHNHDFEFRPLGDGSLPIQHLAADPAIHLELDVAWVAKAGMDPKPWIEGYTGRIAALHVKDIAPRNTPQDEGGWADVGRGALPWPRLWQAGITAGASLMIAEHDMPSDFDRFARRSLEAMRRFALTGEAVPAGE
jgi:sugar phosphate isomerase/epimerase